MFPFLTIGETSAIFQSAGSVPLSRESRQILVMPGANSEAQRQLGGHVPAYMSAEFGIFAPPS